jgi:putative oxidoreductase
MWRAKTDTLAAWTIWPRNYWDDHWHNGQALNRAPEILVHCDRPAVSMIHSHPHRINVALLILRIAAAIVFLYHGSAILFGAFGGPGPQQFAAGLHAPTWVGYLVGLAQFCGGLAVASGILFRLGAACIAIVMLGAIFLEHLPHGFNIANGGMEYAFTELLLATALIVAGPGDWSLRFGKPRSS